MYWWIFDVCTIQTWSQIISTATSDIWALFFHSNICVKDIYLEVFVMHIGFRLCFLLYNLYVRLKSTNSLCNAWCVWMSVSYLVFAYSFYRCSSKILRSTYESFLVSFPLLCITVCYENNHRTKIKAKKK